MNRSLDRRSAFRLFGAAGLGLGLAACAGPGGGSSGASDGASPSALATSGPVKGTVSFAHWRAEDKAVFADLIKTFAKKYPDAGVEQDIAPSADTSRPPCAASRAPRPVTSSPPSGARSSSRW